VKCPAFVQTLRAWLIYVRKASEDAGTPVKKLHPDLLPYRGDWFLRRLGIAIANHVMHDRFSFICQSSARRHRESWEAQGDWRVLPMNRAGACTWSRVRTQIPYIFEVDT
jgi:hypothetical protein